MIPICLAALLTAPAQAPAPPPQSPAEVAAALKVKALNPETLKREAGQARACPYLDAREEDPKEKWKASAGTGFYAGKSPTADQTILQDDERMPVFFPPEQRRDASAFAPTLADGKITRVADLKGFAVVVFLFNPTCLYTGDVLPELLRLYALSATRTFRVVFVSVGTEGWVGLEKYRKLNQATFPPGLPLHRLSTVPGAGLSALGDFRFHPSTYILDRQGRIAWRVTGAIRGAIADKLNQVLSEP